LCHVADILSCQCRAGDVLGRIGGEEFAIVLPDTDKDTAFGLAEKIREQIEQHPILLKEGALSVTASIGLAWSSDSGLTFKAIQQQADEAMYLAKQAGRNRVSMLTE
jgi:diguanylate cyclase (GGDEF)-like protein